MCVGVAIGARLLPARRLLLRWHLLRLLMLLSICCCSCRRRRWLPCCCRLRLPIARCSCRSLELRDDCIRPVDGPKLCFVRPLLFLAQLLLQCFLLSPLLLHVCYPPLPPPLCCCSPQLLRFLLPLDGFSFALGLVCFLFQLRRRVSSCQGPKLSHALQLPEPFGLSI